MDNLLRPINNKLTQIAPYYYKSQKMEIDTYEIMEKHADHKSSTSLIFSGYQPRG